MSPPPIAAFDTAEPAADALRPHAVRVASLVEHQPRSSEVWPQPAGAATTTGSPGTLSLTRAGDPGGLLSQNSRPVDGAQRTAPQHRRARPLGHTARERTEARLLPPHCDCTQQLRACRVLQRAAKPRIKALTSA